MAMSKAEELKEQGIRLFRERDYEAASRLFLQAADEYKTENRPDMAAEMKTNIGLVHRSLGEYQQALDVMQEALVTFQESEDALRCAQVLGNMGGVYVALGDKEQAYNCYRQAADIFDELGEKKLYGETMLAIGDLQMRDGKLMDGATTYRSGLEFLEKPSARQKVLRGLSRFINRYIRGRIGG